MDNIAIESFIAHCDDMMIAEESVRDMKSLFKSELNKANTLKRKAFDTKGDLKKMLPLYKEAKQILLDLQKKVNEMETSAFDKVISKSGAVISILTSIGSAIGMLLCFDNKSVSPKSLFAGSAVGAITYVGMQPAVFPLRNRIYKKEELLNIIKDEIYKTSVCIMVCSNPSKYQKYLHGSSYTETDLLNANTQNEISKRLAIMEKIRDEIQLKMRSILKEAGLPTEFKISDDATSIYLDADNNILNKFYYNTNMNKISKIQKYFEKITEDEGKKFKKCLLQMGYSGIEKNSPDDFLKVVLIESGFLNEKAKTIIQI